MSAIFDFSSVLMILLLMICTSCYLRELRPGIFDGNRTGFGGFCWKMSRVGERMSPFVGAGCLFMAAYVLFK
ncbi:hypothetical protein FRACYDRAFT_184075 [Fragilariopsis cylindrus CCMP1102]|uniref:Protein kish n=1 Tax=Fragilariopsis cylindrus CCMP1102 TaxID=635003 RepID=A0A1E7FGH4_9STRA|nr:hypothetical protein FRACYDRAFT_184075 [Fragilariopsis cylindrus CCMP1102]|eukprot:OEU17278.1 hypothetical protein FRACYDRAFT_184075 [Fragilariopsis cylindrus CCMP1102]